MDCKFKQIIGLKECYTLPVQGSESAVNNAINCLIRNVGDHADNKSAIQKSKTFLKNKIVTLEVNSVQQVYQNRPTIPSIIREDISPNKATVQCMRPMSAQIRKQSYDHRMHMVNSDSKKSIQSNKSVNSYLRNRKNNSSTRSLIDKQKTNNYNNRNSSQTRFFSVKNSLDDDPINLQFIQSLRLRKSEEQNQRKKKQEFLKSIQFDSTLYSSAQSKFIQSVSRKKFIYGSQGQIIEINGNSNNNHLKKISSMSKSRVQVKPKTSAQLSKFQEDLKQNIYIEFKGRETPKRPQAGKVNFEEKSKQINLNLKSQVQLKLKIESTNRPFSGTSKKLVKQASKRQRQCKTLPIGQQLSKKPIQKILFYNSANSVYRVINDCPSVQKQQKVGTQNIGQK